MAINTCKGVVRRHGRISILAIAPTLWALNYPGATPDFRAQKIQRANTFFRFDGERTFLFSKCAPLSTALP